MLMFNEDDYSSDDQFKIKLTKISDYNSKIE